MSNLDEIIARLQNNEVVAYPTEAVFGLGCNPNSEDAVQALLTLKQRPVEKGLILLASDLRYLRPFIDESRLTEKEWQSLTQVGAQAITWVVPAKKSVPRYLTGQFDTIAVVMLCDSAGFALTSTSANLTGLPPCRTAQEVYAQFGNDFPVLEQATGGAKQPSEIRDIFTQHIFRQG